MPYTNLPLTSDRQRDLLPAPHQHPRDHGQRRLHHRPRLRHPADEQDARPVRRRLLQPRLQGLQRARRQEAGGLHHPEGALLIYIFSQKIANEYVTLSPAELYLFGQCEILQDDQKEDFSRMVVRLFGTEAYGIKIA